jgi:prepilin-type N-terminal cleavage/methylation domain-containing protein
MQKRIFRLLFPNHSESLTENGFTIIELLIVIVIIVIMVAITALSYITVQSHAIASSIQSDLLHASDQLVIDQSKSSTGVFPATLSATSSPILWSGSTTSTYTVNNTNTPKTFCLTATNSGQNYFITQEGIPLPGTCPVLYLDAGIQTSYPGTGTVWNDLSGNGNNANLMGGVSYNSANNGSLVFDGSSGRAAVNDNSSLDFGTGSFTVEAWLKLSAYGPDYTELIYKGAPSGYSGWRYGISTTGVPCMLIGDTSTYSHGCFGTTPIGLNAWHDLTIVYNRSSYAAGYIDGVKVGTVDISASSGSVNNTSEIDISNGINLGGWWNGQIGLIYIRNVALSDSDVTNSFNALRGRYGL